MSLNPGNSIIALAPDGIGREIISRPSVADLMHSNSTFNSNIFISKASEESMGRRQYNRL
jgi:hypothetical protein